MVGRCRHGMELRKNGGGRDDQNRLIQWSPIPPLIHRKESSPPASRISPHHVSCFIMATPSEEALRIALESVLLKDGSDDEGVVDGIDGMCLFAHTPS